MEKNEQLLSALSHALGGGKFEYTSYNHKLASAEYKLSNQYKDSCNLCGCKLSVDKHMIPVETRKKYAVKRIGKLRSVEFYPDATIKRLKIGCKYSLSFYSIDDLKFV